MHAITDRRQPKANMLNYFTKNDGNHFKGYTETNGRRMAIEKVKPENKHSFKLKFKFCERKKEENF